MSSAKTLGDSGMNSLEYHLFELEQWLRQIPDAPAWSCVQLVELSNVDPHLPPDLKHRLREPAEYAVRFAELASAGYAWINLSGLGMLDDTLVVTVEKPSRTSNCPRSRTSVNYSGPTNMVRERAGWQLSDYVKETP